MTDEQLDEIDQAMSDGAVTWYQLERLLADYRRLRDLERACLGYFHRDSVTGDVYPPTYYRTASEVAALVTIGRLLEGEG